MLKLKSPYMLIIYGPTGVGKTDIALKLAQHLPAEIINMDVGQFYEPLSIGTAKPSWQNESAPHHLFDIIKEPQSITVTQYNELLKIKLNEIFNRGALPILVGGSGFYLKSILFPPLADSSLLDGVQVETVQDSDKWNKLCEIDPVRANQIHKNDSYRIERALAIWKATGKKPSDYVATYMPPCSYKIIMINRDRQELYRRIDERVIQMMNAGWIEETQLLVGTEWEEFLKTKKIIGYEEIFHYLAGLQSKDEKENLIANVQQRTRNYAKRQLTFWTSLKKSLNSSIANLSKNEENHSEFTSINLTLCDDDLYIEQLLAQLLKHFSDK